MPLINDKDRYKKLSASDRVRSRIIEEPNLSNNLVKVNQTSDLNQKAREKDTDEKRIETTISSKKATKINFVKPSANIVTNIFTLEKGESLVNVILCNLSAADEGTGPVVDIHWSYSPSNQLEFTNSGGEITTVTGGKTARLLIKQLGVKETVTFSQTLSSIITSEGGHSVSTLSMFSNVSKNIYFYYVAANNTIDITYSIKPS